MLRNLIKLFLCLSELGQLVTTKLEYYVFYQWIKCGAFNHQYSERRKMRCRSLVRRVVMLRRDCEILSMLLDCQMLSLLRDCQMLSLLLDCQMLRPLRDCQMLRPLNKTDQDSNLASHILSWVCEMVAQRYRRDTARKAIKDL